MSTQGVYFSNNSKQKVLISLPEMQILSFYVMQIRYLKNSIRDARAPQPGEIVFNTMRYRSSEITGPMEIAQLCKSTYNKATAAAVISRLRISNNGELKEI